jgi:hypothetical protein
VRYAPILELRISHSFYTEARCPDFEIKPSDETSQLLCRHRCLFLSSLDGFQVVASLDATGRPFLPLPADAVLLFDLILRSDEFLFFTDLSDPPWALSGDDPARPGPVFTNAGIATDALSLISRAGARRLGVFAVIEIHLDDLDHVGSDAAMSYQLAFRSLQARWASYCVTDLPGSSTLTVVDASPPDVPHHLQFVPKPETADPIAAELTLRYPSMRCLCLMTDQVVALSEEPRKYLELRRDGQRLSGPLPNPSMRDISRDNFLFHILKVKAQPSSTP